MEQIHCSKRTEREVFPKAPFNDLLRFGFKLLYRILYVLCNLLLILRLIHLPALLRQFYWLSGRIRDRKNSGFRQQREAIQNISISAFRSIAGLKKEEQLAELYISQLEEELDAMTE